jgi:hypothetical protein
MHTMGERADGTSAGEIDTEAEVLIRAEALVDQAARRLEEQGEQLERLYGLVECLVKVGPPLAVVEAWVVRAWTPALESLTGVGRGAAVGMRLSRVLPDLRPAGAHRWCWTSGDGSRWSVVAHMGECPYEILRWDRPLEDTGATR